MAMSSYYTCGKGDKIAMQSFFEGNPQGTLSSDCKQCINACGAQPNSQCVFECFGSQSDLVEKNVRFNESDDLSAGIGAEIRRQKDQVGYHVVFEGQRKTY